MAKVKGGYVDGFVLVAPKSKLRAYKKMAGWGKKLWMKHGALDYKECVGDDLKAKSMGGVKPLSFTQIAKPRKDETVIFSFVVFKSRAHRDRVNAKIMKDPVMNDPKNKNMEMPFDPKRMAYGGFKVIVSS